jgi:predicted enzyme related to lactoylglutathione lyase
MRMASDPSPSTTPSTPPSPTNGKICYLKIPGTDPRRAAAFYAAVFGWRIRERKDGSIAFDDTTGQVSGTWSRGRSPAGAVGGDGGDGVLIYIMVDSVAASVRSVVAHGGEIVRPVGADAPEITARFRDLDGNIFGLYQEPEARPTR